MVRGNVEFSNVEMSLYGAPPYIWVSASAVMESAVDDHGNQLHKPFGRIYALHITKWFTLSLNRPRTS